MWSKLVRVLLFLLLVLNYVFFFSSKNWIFNEMFYKISGESFEKNRFECNFLNFSLL